MRALCDWVAKETWRPGAAGYGSGGEESVARREELAGLGSRTVESEAGEGGIDESAGGRSDRRSIHGAGVRRRH